VGRRLRAPAIASGAVGTVAALVVAATAVGIGGGGVADAAPSTKSSARRDEIPHEVHVPIDAALVARARAENEAKVRDFQMARWYAAVVERFRPKTGVNWDGIARCETGGNWSMRGSRYSGGLGFYNGTWNSFGGREFAANAGMATREQQIVVAERVYARYGLSGWGCRRYG
jgi:hypothetical protein